MSVVVAGIILMMPIIATVETVRDHRIRTKRVTGQAKQQARVFRA